MMRAGLRIASLLGIACAARAQPAQQGRMSVVLGTMTMGGQANASEARSMLELWLGSGHTAELDTARVYQGGRTEELLGSLLGPPSSPLHGKFKLATKVPSFGGGFKPRNIERMASKSLRALDTSRVQILYLHSPDTKSTVEEALDGLARVHRAGGFVELGLSNYAAREVERFSALCSQKGLPKVSVYQGLYNPISRDVEAGLLPTLRALGVRFYAYNPLAGGLLTGKHTAASLQGAQTGRFRQKLYQNRYLSQPQVAAAEAFVAACVAANVPPAHAALRWMVHHSALRADLGDAILVGASSARQLRDNLAGLAGGPLPQPLLSGIDAAWHALQASGHAATYVRGFSKGAEHGPDRMGAR